MSTTGKFGLDAELEAKALAKYSKEEEQNARQWITAVTGDPMVGDFIECLKTGVVLCKLAEAIMPGSVGKFNPSPKHYLESKGNIGMYITACNKIGVPSQDMITPLDLSDSKADPSQVLNHIFALARQSQAVGFHGPTLGVRYYKSREEQLALEAKKAKEREEEARRMAEYEKMLLEKRDLAIEKKKVRNSEAHEHLQARKANRFSAREKRGRSKSLKEAPGAHEVKQRSPSPIKYGMDAEHEERVGKKYNYELEDALLDWIEDITGYSMNGFVENLRSGIVLCELLNKIVPNMVRNIHTKKGQRSTALNELENLRKFLDGCVGLGVPPGELFQPHDLYDQKNLVQVQSGLYALARYCAESPTYAHVPKIKYGPYGVRSTPRSRRSTMQGDEISETELDPDSWLPSWKATSPPKPGSAAFVIAFLALLSMISGFGDVAGISSITRFVHLCVNSTETGCYGNSDFFFYTVGAELFGFAIAGLLLEFLGPKISCSLGIITRIIGCVLLGFVSEAAVLWTIGMCLLAAGGPIVLVSLLPLAHVYPNRIGTSQFGLVAFFVFGSCVISLGFSYLPETPLRNYIMWGYGGLHFIFLVISILTVPLSRWIATYQPIPSENEEGADDSPKSWCCQPKHIFICLFATVLLVQNAWQLQLSSFTGLFWMQVEPTLFIIIPIVAGLVSVACIPFGLLSDYSGWGAQSTLLLAILTSAIGNINIFVPLTVYPFAFCYTCLIISNTFVLSVWFSFLSVAICKTRIGLSVFLSGFLAGLLMLPGVFLLALFTQNIDIVIYVKMGLFGVAALFVFYPIAKFVKLCNVGGTNYQTV